MKGLPTQAVAERAPVLTPAPVLSPGDADDMMPARFPPTRDAYYLLPRSNTPIRMPLPMRRSGWPGGGESEALHRVDELPRDKEGSRALVYRVPDSRETAAAVDRFAALMYANDSGEASEDLLDEDPVSLPLPAPVPAWLSGPEDTELDGFDKGEDFRSFPLHETLEGSRERMASRRFGLHQALQGGKPETPRKTSAEPATPLHAPLFVVFSMAGGVGKTSLVATLGRALSFAGERVVLADATPHGLLPFYYGAQKSPPAAGQPFAAPEERPGTHVHLFTLKVEESREPAAEAVKAALARESEGATCLLLDLPSTGVALLSSLSSSYARVLVPLAPDMNSVITLAAVEKLFADVGNTGDPAPQPVYLLVGFDSAEALHLDVREVLRQQLGQRLLPFVIRRSSAIAEALAEGMTVIDFAPESTIAADYMAVAQWLRSKPAENPLSRQGTLWNEH